MESARCSILNDSVSRRIKMPFRILILVAGLVVAIARADLPEFARGQEVSVPWDGLKNPLVVRLPDDYAIERRWPIVFHFHGTGGNPTIDVPLRYTGGNGFILVGMEYITRDLPAATPDYLEREWAHLLAVRETLGEKIRLDPARTIVGGFSQGGWFASEFAEVHGAELGGAYVLGAGKRPRDKRAPKPFGLKRPIYLGAGQLDPNYIYSVQGIRHFSSLGGVVTFEDYLGFGHQMPMGRKDEPLAPGLRQWFLIESLRPDLDRIRSAAAAWQKNLFERTEAEADPRARWLLLSRAKRSPLFAWLAPGDQQPIALGIETFEKSSPPEVAARSHYFSLVDRELRGPADGNLWSFFRDQARRYHACWQAAPDTYHGRRAAMEFSRLRSDLGQLDRWRFPNDEAREKALAEATKGPLPDTSIDELTREFRDLRLKLDHE
jgi:pimeloyl-ACP methyl ester carboxylesterase